MTFTGITWINRCATWARLLLSHNDEDWKTCIEGGGAMKWMWHKVKAPHPAFPLPSSQIRADSQMSSTDLCPAGIAGTAGIKGGSLTSNAAAHWNTIPLWAAKNGVWKSKSGVKIKIQCETKIWIQVAMKMKSLSQINVTFHSDMITWQTTWIVTLVFCIVNVSNYKKSQSFLIIRCQNVFANCVGSSKTCTLEIQIYIWLRQLWIWKGIAFCRALSHPDIHSLLDDLEMEHPAEFGSHILQLPISGSIEGLQTYTLCVRPCRNAHYHRRQPHQTNWTMHHVTMMDWPDST